MKVCPKCQTLALGDKAMRCPNCDEPLLDFKTLKEILKLRESD